jgi:hypothetical protein
LLTWTSGAVAQLRRVASQGSGLKQAGEEAVAAGRRLAGALNAAEVRTATTELLDRQHEYELAQERAARLRAEADRVQELSESPRLGAVLQRMSALTEYRDQLSVVTRTRDRFEAIDAAVTQARRRRPEQGDQERPAEDPGFQRVLIMLDDLDRCPPEKVVAFLLALVTGHPGLANLLLPALARPGPGASVQATLSGLAPGAVLLRTRHLGAALARPLRAGGEPPPDRSARGCLGVLLVGDGVTPFRRAPDAHRDVRHGAVGLAAVVVPLSRRDGDDVAGDEQVALPVPRAHPAAAAHAEQELPAGVRVPVRPGAGREVHHRDADAARRGQPGAEPHLPAEPPRVTLLVGALVRLGDPHRCLSSPT